MELLQAFFTSLFWIWIRMCLCGYGSATLVGHELKVQFLLRIILDLFVVSRLSHSCHRSVWRVGSQILKRIWTATLLFQTPNLYLSICRQKRSNINVNYHLAITGSVTQQDLNIICYNPTFISYYLLKYIPTLL